MRPSTQAHELPKPPRRPSTQVQYLPKPCVMPSTQLHKLPKLLRSPVHRPMSSQSPAQSQSVLKTTCETQQLSEPRLAEETAMPLLGRSDFCVIPKFLLVPMLSEVMASICISFPLVYISASVAGGRSHYKESEKTISSSTCSCWAPRSL